MPGWLTHGGQFTHKVAAIDPLFVLFVNLTLIMITLNTEKVSFAKFPESGSNLRSGTDRLIVLHHRSNGHAELNAISLKNLFSYRYSTNTFLVVPVHLTHRVAQK